MEDSNFRYLPFCTNSSIRTINVAPECADDPSLRCRLIVRELDQTDNCPQPSSTQRTTNQSVDNALGYVALSYVWGDVSNPKTITLDDKPCLVGSSLHEALVRFRRAVAQAVFPPQPLWVDAICINQADIAERESQVRLMGRIYEQADFVVVDLGRSLATSKTLADFHDFVSQLNERHQPATPESLYDPYVYIPFSSYELGISPPTEDTTKAILSIFFTKYFTRAWVRQEFTLAKDAYFMSGELVIGHTSLWNIVQILINWIDMNGDFAHARIALNGANEYDDTLLQSISQGLMSLFKQRAVRLENLDSRKKSLLSNIKLARPSIATDLRDKIYSLIGLSSDGEGFLQEINYRESVESVYRQFARRFVENGQTMELLYQADSRISPSLPLPSWIPVSAPRCCVTSAKSLIINSLQD